MTSIIAGFNCIIKQVFCYLAKLKIREMDSWVTGPGWDLVRVRGGWWCKGCWRCLWWGIRGRVRLRFSSIKNKRQNILFWIEKSTVSQRELLTDLCPAVMMSMIDPTTLNEEEKSLFLATTLLLKDFYGFCRHLRQRG